MASHSANYVNGFVSSDSEPNGHVNGEKVASKGCRFEETDELVIDGESLSIEDLLGCGRGRYRLRLSDEAKENVVRSRALLDEYVKQGKVVYGVTTGFGNFANVTISSEKIEELQENLIRSHSAGVGPNLDPWRTRMLLALRINVLAKGFSGISLTVLNQLIDAFNAYCVSYVPEQGTVGCSGDLCPLAHLALGLMGEGKMWSPETGWDDAIKVLTSHGLRPLKLGAKEGLALINGTQMVSALGAEATVRAKSIARQADVIAALTLEVVKGNTAPFIKKIHELRPHPGQMLVAHRVRQLLPSKHNRSCLADSSRSARPVQDAYVLRCIPQVHGIVNDTIDFVEKIISVEINSATDNPLVFGEERKVVSCGNFHGEYPAKVLDFLAIAVHELAQISERRLERMINPALSNGLPPFLVKEGGLNSGFMMVQVTAASLVSENKVLCHPSSVDSITTSASQEDHVSMGGFSARKCLKIMDNVEHVLAMELLAACQALEFLKPMTTTVPLQRVYRLVRSVVAPLDKDRTFAADIETVTELLKSDQVWGAVRDRIETGRRYSMNHYLTTEDDELLDVDDAMPLNPPASTCGFVSPAPALAIPTADA